MKSLLGLKCKTGLSLETGRACRPDITGKNRSIASASIRQKIVAATSNVKLSRTSRPLDISTPPHAVLAVVDRRRRAAIIQKRDLQIRCNFGRAAHRAVNI